MGENRQKPVITVPDNNKNFKGAGFKRWDAFVANYLAEHPERKLNPPADSKKRKKK